MLLAKVVGTVVCTRKEPGLTGVKMLLIQPLDLRLNPEGPESMALDAVQAGVGDLVLIVNEGGQRSMHPDVKEPSNRTPLKDIKLLPDDPQAMMPQIAEIKKRYTTLFGN